MAMAVSRPGREVLLPAPWYFNHQMALAMHGVRAVPLPCRAADGFLPDPERAAALVGARTRALVLVTPNNPTGAVYPPAVIGRFAELCRARGPGWCWTRPTATSCPPNRTRRTPCSAGRLGGTSWCSSTPSRRRTASPGHRVGAIVGARVSRRVDEGGGQHADLSAAPGASRAGLGASGAARMAGRQPRHYGRRGRRPSGAFLRRARRNGGSTRSAPISPRCACRTERRIGWRRRSGWRRNAGCWPSRAASSVRAGSGTSGSPSPTRGRTPSRKCLGGLRAGSPARPLPVVPGVGRATARSSEGTKPALLRCALLNRGRRGRAWRGAGHAGVGCGIAVADRVQRQPLSSFSTSPAR